MTEPERIEQVLDEFNQFNTQIIESMPDGLIALDHDLRYRVWNPRMEAMSGLNASEVLGKRPLDVFPFLQSTGVLDQISRALAGETLTSSDFPFEVPQSGRRGWSMQIMGPLRNCRNEIIGVLVHVIDVTARKEAEEALRTSEERFRLSFEGASDAIFWVDANSGIVTHCNQAAELLLGRNRAEIIGQPQTFLHPAEDAERYRELFETYTKTERKTNVETEVLRKDGRRVIVSIAPSTTTIGRQKIVQGIFRDITEIRRIDEELRASRQRLELLSRQLITIQETERRHLARELHDEIGQVLTAIKMNLRRSQRTADDTLKQQLDENAGMVDQAIAQVRNLALSLRPAQLDELGLVAALHWLLKQQAGFGGFAEHLEVDLADVQIPTELETVCFRITQEALTNAVRHGHASKVGVKLWAKDDKLFLSIQDDGVGFDAVGCHRRALGGSSFGLVSIQERARLVGGQATIESTQGLGTTVSLWIPMSPDKTGQISVRQ